MSRGAQFRMVKKPEVRRNKMDLRNEKRLTADPFFLYPVMLEKCIPGDVWKIGNEMIVRMNPLVAPMMHEINAYVHYYFVPFRLLWDQWEDWISGGSDGRFVADLPKWTPAEVGPAFNAQKNSLWDYCFGHATIDPGSSEIIHFPESFPLRAYNLIWNEYYRDQNILEEVDITKQAQQFMYPGLRKRAWEKDYFTSLLPWQQRGDAPGLPITGSAIVNYQPPIQNNLSVNELIQYLNEGRGRVQFDSASTFDVSDLRLAFQIQKFLERNARSGARYVEFLKAHFPAWPRDDRLNRPEYIGGSKSPIIVSEVLQTSNNDNDATPQGNMAGHGITADRTFCGTYKVQEHGLIMGLLSFLPRAMYQQGIDRQWLAESKYDYYFPEFSALSEQAVMQPELYNLTGASKDTVLGYQGRYDEYRFRRNMVHGQFRDEFQYWHMGRVFSTPPQLNEALIYPTDEEIQAIKRVLAVPTEPMFLIAFGNLTTAIRPMPWIAEPGLIDHF